METLIWNKYCYSIIQILLCRSLDLSGPGLLYSRTLTETTGIFVAVFLTTTVGLLIQRDAAKKFSYPYSLERGSL